MFKINCEWDVGHEDLIFASEAAATKWLRASPNLLEMAEEDGKNIISYLLMLRYDGLLSVEEMEVIE